MGRGGAAAVTDGGRGTGGAPGAAAAAGDAKLLQLGLESAVDRRRIMSVVTGEEEFPPLINWYEVRLTVGFRREYASVLLVLTLVFTSCVCRNKESYLLACDY